MPELKTWECPKCKKTATTPALASAFYKPCHCGNNREWKMVSGPPRPEEKRVPSNKEKEKK